MIRKNGQIIIEVGRCDYSRFYVVLAGFHTEKGASEVDVASQRTDVTGATIYGQDTQSNYFRNSASDQDIGLRVSYNPNTAIVKAIQLSLIHIGVREFVGPSYPNQIS